MRTFTLELYDANATIDSMSEIGFPMMRYRLVEKTITSFAWLKGVKWHKHKIVLDNLTETDIKLLKEALENR